MTVPTSDTGYVLNTLFGLEMARPLKGGRVLVDCGWPMWLLLGATSASSPSSPTART